MLAGDNITKGNAVVNQVASLSYLIAPMAGSVFYSVFGLKPVMCASVICFFVTALFECFIRLDYERLTDRQNVFVLIREDFSSSMRFIFKAQPNIVKMLLLVSVSRFFVMGITIVGLPYIVRTILGLNARYYGAAESALAVATIIGSIAAGVLAGKLKIHNFSQILMALGIFIIPAGMAFLFPISKISVYTINVFSFCGMQIAVSIFSIFAVSLIQQKTPNQMIGKVMAYTSAITLCVQPIGQMVYGFLFDGLRDKIYLVLIPTGVIVCMIGVPQRGFLGIWKRSCSYQTENYRRGAFRWGRLPLGKKQNSGQRSLKCL